MRCSVWLGAVLIAFALVAAPRSVAAQAPEDELFSLDEDDLFGSGGDLLVEGGAPTGKALEEAFLVSDGVEIGGTYRLSVDADWAWAGAAPQAQAFGVGARIGGALYVDSRPRRDFRLFAKVKGDAPLTGQGSPGPVLTLHELFSDFDIGDRVFFRAGKQTVNWGVGYFFSPADIINIGRIDPERPEAEREGPIALRVNVPSGSDNLYAYAIFDGEAADQGVALAPKAEFVTGGSEVGFGLYYRADRAPRAMTTLSTSLGGASLFGEAVLSKGSDKRFVETAPVSPGNPLGLAVFEEKERLFVHVTAGLRFVYPDPERRFTLSGAGQYYYNGEGYDGATIKDNRIGLFQLLATGQLAATDLMSTGRHYGALSVGWTSVLVADVNPNLFWFGNLSDGSGMLSLSAGYSGWNDVRPTIGISRTYGEAGSEYALTGPVTRLAVGISVSGAF